MLTLRWGYVATAFVVCACGGTSDDGSTEEGVGSGGEGGATGEGGGGGAAPMADGTCSPDGARLLLRGAFEAVSTNAEAGADPGGRGVVAVMGDDEEGNTVYWRRAGDIGDAAISETGTFDVSEYPNNIQFVRAVTRGGEILEGFYGMAGTLTVTEVSPNLRATFHLEALQDSSDPEAGPGDPIDGVVDGCIAAPVVATGP